MTNKTSNLDCLGRKILIKYKKKKKKKKKENSEKLQVSTKYPQKYWRQGNLTAYFFDYTTRCINKISEKQTKGCIFLLSNMGDLGITKNYSGINFTTIANKVYNAMFLNHNRPEIEKILKKTKKQKQKQKQNKKKTLYGFPRNLFINKIFTIRLNTTARADWFLYWWKKIRVANLKKNT